MGTLRPQVLWEGGPGFLVFPAPMLPLQEPQAPEQTQMPQGETVSLSTLIHTHPTRLSYSDRWAPPTSLQYLLSFLSSVTEEVAPPPSSSHQEAPWKQVRVLPLKGPPCSSTRTSKGLLASSQATTFHSACNRVKEAELPELEAERGF